MLELLAMLAASTAVPAFDTATYCERLSEMPEGGHSYVLERTCRDMENSARERIPGRTDDEAIMVYCTRVAENAAEGAGSYTMLETCIGMETAAKAKLR